MELKKSGRGRKGALFGFITVAAVMALGATAFACVYPKGQMTVTVDGAPGTPRSNTTVVGLGADYDGGATNRIFGYCTDPTNAASGLLTDVITVTVAPAPSTSSCNDSSNKLDAGEYRVAYNHEKTHTYDGTDWSWIDQTGCFLGGNWGYTSWEMVGADSDVDAPDALRMTVDTSGHGKWQGVVDPEGLTYNPNDVAADPNAAASICVGRMWDPNDVDWTLDGTIAPYRLLLNPVI